jgi:hypothetical protein
MIKKYVDLKNNYNFSFMFLEWRIYINFFGDNQRTIRTKIRKTNFLHFHLQAFY